MAALSDLVRYQLYSNGPEFRHGQGAIWRARDLLFDEDVAIKEIQADLRDDTEAVRTFSKEAAAGARLGRICTNIVKVSDYGRIDEVLYFVMEWIEGGNLGNRCGHISLQEAKSIMRQICNAVDTAHRNGIVHSDIAPLNILYDQNADHYKLADFGYLKIVDSILISAGSGPMLRGGRQYFLPLEHLRAPERINKSTDVYAMALTFHALLSGQALSADNHGRLKVPGVIQVRHENKSAPDEVRQLLGRFVEGQQDTNSVDEFRRYLDRIA